MLIAPHVAPRYVRGWDRAVGADFTSWGVYVSPTFAHELSIKGGYLIPGELADEMVALLKTRRILRDLR